MFVIILAAHSGHGCPRRNACLSGILAALTEVLGRDIRANDPRMSAGRPPQKLPLWADFSFLMFATPFKLDRVSFSTPSFNFFTLQSLVTVACLSELRVSANKSTCQQRL